MIFYFHFWFIFQILEDFAVIHPEEANNFHTQFKDVAKSILKFSKEKAITDLPWNKLIANANINLEEISGNYHFIISFLKFSFSIGREELPDRGMQEGEGIFFQ